MADMTAAEKLSGLGGKQHIPAIRAGGPLKGKVGRASGIARYHSHVVLLFIPR